MRLAVPLEPAWVWRSKHKPRPAWPGPAKRDSYNKVERLESRLSFDRVFHVVAADGRVYFGSSADDQVRCLDASSGRELWTFFTEAPVRFAPTVHGGKVLVGSDDGRAYCLDAKTGKELWRHRAAPRDVRIPGNDRLMSPWPVRTGVVVRGKIAYFCAGLFPSEGGWLCAVRVGSGKVVYQQPLTGTHPQGYMLASRASLYVPTGRGRPAVHERKSGRKIRDLGGQGGTFALLAGDSLIYGPGKSGQLGEFQTGVKDQVATFQGLHMIVLGDHAWLHRGHDLSALHRTRFLRLVGEQRALNGRRRGFTTELKKEAKEAKQKKRSLNRAKMRRLQQAIAKLGDELDQIKGKLPGCVLWRKPCSLRFEMIKTKDRLFVGGDGVVAAYSSKTGEEVWRAPVDGRAWGLAAAGGRLYASTDEGVIHCFAGGAR